MKIQCRSDFFNFIVADDLHNPAIVLLFAKEILMSLKAITKTNVVTIGKNASLKDASRLMQREHVGSLVVIENYFGNKVATGIITDRDIALSVCSATRPQGLNVEHIMQSQPITINVSEGIFEAAQLMGKNGVKRLPVINEDGSLYGIVSADDILSLMSDEINHLAKVSDTQIKKEHGIHRQDEQNMYF